MTLSKPLFGSSVDWTFSTVMPIGIVDPLFDEVSVVVSGTADEIKNKYSIIKFQFYCNILFNNQ